MKKSFLLALLLSLLLVSCSKEDSATQSATPYGDLATPAWAVDSTYNLDRSMTAVVTVAQLGVADTSVIVPVAVDSADLIARIESLDGQHVLEAAERLGVGSRAYELVEID